MNSPPNPAICSQERHQEDKPGSGIVAVDDEDEDLLGRTEITVTVEKLVHESAAHSRSERKRVRMMVKFSQAELPESIRSLRNLHSSFYIAFIVRHQSHHDISEMSISKSIFSNFSGMDSHIPRFSNLIYPSVTFSNQLEKI